jgi:hypothetical protein
MDGRSYLEKLISDSLRADGKAFDRREIRGVAIGLVAAGALRQEEAERILADLDVTLQRSGLLKVVRLEGAATSQVVAPRPVGRERPGWRQAIEEPPPPVLRHVVSLAGRTLTAGELTAQLVSLEVWSAFVVLTVAHRGVDPRRLRDHFTADWRGWDDVGTQYRGGRAGGSGSAALFVERRVFEPGPPEEARLLTVVVGSSGGPVTVVVPVSPGQ